MKSKRQYYNQNLIGEGMEKSWGDVVETQYKTLAFVSSMGLTLENEH
jgi:hypothetical protein